MITTTLSILLIAGSVGPDIGKLFIHEDWVVGCDNRRGCHAASLPASEDGTINESDDRDLNISILRSYGPDAYPQITIGIISDKTAARVKGQTITIRTDGRSVPVSIVERGGVFDVSGIAALRLVSNIRNAEILTLTDSEGADIASASLRGLKASLLYMDEQQFRTGTVSALATTGQHQANAFTIPPMVPSPVVLVSPEPANSPARLTNDQIEALLEADSCQSGTDHAQKPSAEYSRLDPETTLMLLPSYCKGYNAGVRIFVLDNEGGAKPAQFGHHPWSDRRETQGGTSLPNGFWDRKRRILSGYSKGRGLGDCGEILEFAWNTRRFRLVKYSGMSECRGSKEFITTYRLDVTIMPRPLVPFPPTPR